MWQTAPDHDQGADFQQIARHFEVDAAIDPKKPSETRLRFFCVNPSLPISSGGPRKLAFQSNEGLNGLAPDALVLLPFRLEEQGLLPSTR